MSLQPGTRFGPYEVLSQLGSGGMGEVYKARDTRLDRRVAIKILRSDTPVSTQARERFEREAWAISRLSHPRVCALFDVGRVDGTAYLVMELLEGETLSARSSKGPMPIAQVLRIGAEIADALEAAHRQGIVHRDLKPANVMLTSSGVKLLDFGLAKGADGAAVTDGSGDAPTVPGPLTAEGTWIGTAAFMAPEQLLGKPTDARTDVFAFGAVLYEMVTGKRAFDGRTVPEIASTILHQEPPAVSSLRPGVPIALSRLIAECLAQGAGPAVAECARPRARAGDDRRRPRPAGADVDVEHARGREWSGACWTRDRDHARHRVVAGPRIVGLAWPDGT